MVSYRKQNVWPTAALDCTSSSTIGQETDKAEKKGAKKSSGTRLQKAAAGCRSHAPGCLTKKGVVICRQVPRLPVVSVAGSRLVGSRDLLATEAQSNF